MPTLYKTDLSPPACAVRILGEMLGLQFDYVDVDFAHLEHKTPEFKKMNPLGTVPVLKDGDFTLTDSHAMSKYLLEKYGTEEQKERFYPSDLRTRAVIEQALFFDAAVYFINVKKIALPAIFGDQVGPTGELLQAVEECYEVVEAYINEQGYLAGDQLTLADIAVGVTTASLVWFLKPDAKKFPKLSAWLAKLWQIPEYAKYCKNFQILEQAVKAAWENNKLKKK